jgi:hypothetical protein
MMFQTPSHPINWLYEQMRSQNRKYHLGQYKSAGWLKRIGYSGSGLYFVHYVRTCCSGLM